MGDVTILSYSRISYPAGGCIEVSVLIAMPRLALANDAAAARPKRTLRHTPMLSWHILWVGFLLIFTCYCVSRIGRDRKREREREMETLII